MKLKSGDLIFLKEVFLGSKEIRDAIRKKKWRRRMREKK